MAMVINLRAIEVYMPVLFSEESFKKWYIPASVFSVEASAFIK
jgi:hypothetical protein